MEGPDICLVTAIEGHALGWPLAEGSERAGAIGGCAGRTQLMSGLSRDLGAAEPGPDLREPGDSFRLSPFTDQCPLLPIMTLKLQDGARHIATAE